MAKSRYQAGDRAGKAGHRSCWEKWDIVLFGGDVSGHFYDSTIFVSLSHCQAAPTELFRLGHNVPQAGPKSGFGPFAPAA
jgi:hypothetical protein